jgi:protein phosphatase 1L
MEDSHAVWDEPDRPFGAEVYDGHGGSLAAVLAAEMLTPFFFDAARIGKAGSESYRLMAEDLRAAYLATDRYIIDQGTDSGAAAATLYIHQNRFLAANAGDVRIVIGDGRRVRELTLDHKPDLPDERVRIEGLGGRVVLLDVARVQGMLAMSRALGDAALKPYVSAEPRITEGVLGKSNDVAILACDGIWEVLTSEEVVGAARAAANPDEAAEQIKTKALNLGSTDNITVIVIDLKAYAAGCRNEHLQITRVMDKAAPPASDTP